MEYEADNLKKKRPFALACKWFVAIVIIANGGGLSAALARADGAAQRGSGPVRVTGVRTGVPFNYGT
jgi:hypothetical protein